MLLAITVGGADDASSSVQLPVFGSVVLRLSITGSGGGGRMLSTL